MNKQLASLLANIFDLKEDQIIPELKKSEVGSWDSLKQMDLVMSLEKEFSIVLEIHDIVKIDSVKTIMDILVSKGIKFET